MKASAYWLNRRLNHSILPTSEGWHFMEISEYSAINYLLLPLSIIKS